MPVFQRLFLSLSLSAFALFSSSIFSAYAETLSSASSNSKAVSSQQKRTLDQAITEFSSGARQALLPHFQHVDIQYPPEKVTLLAIKERHIIEVWATSGGQTRFIKQYFIWSASGEVGPKLTEGDKQVPEGIYQITGLNPNSKFHLSMALNYPNAFDLKWAKAEGRDNPGSDIFIHGKSYSVGCLAVGDKNIEELFILAVDTGIRNIEVIIAPEDPRKKPLIPKESDPDWVRMLYKDIESAFLPYSFK
ncbi:murein L,D-transpeptidase family protein [Vibrio sp. HN007]|uniref:L,D-transpeptidase family protein n=1 Tax=Vibrio iocasae TaxID=3098914 RepID=UPI0035D44F97